MLPQVAPVFTRDIFSPLDAARKRRDWSVGRRKGLDNRDKERRKEGLDSARGPKKI